MGSLRTVLEGFRHPGVKYFKVPVVAIMFFCCSPWTSTLKHGAADNILDVLSCNVVSSLLDQVYKWKPPSEQLDFLAPLYVGPFHRFRDYHDFGVFKCYCCPGNKHPGVRVTSEISEGALLPLSPPAFRNTHLWPTSALTFTLNKGLSLWLKGVPRCKNPHRNKLKLLTEFFVLNHAKCCMCHQEVVNYSQNKKQL